MQMLHGCLTINLEVASPGLSNRVNIVGWLNHVCSIIHPMPLERAEPVVDKGCFSPWHSPSTALSAIVASL
jgi:hypothetical protein